MQRQTWGQWRRWRVSQKVILPFILAFAAFYSARFIIGKKYSSVQLNVYVQNEPTSFDPSVFDASHLQPFQSISNIKLFTAYKDAKISAQLVKSWKSENSYTDWTFSLRKDITFSDGSSVRCKDAVQSLQRIAFISKSKKSKNGLVEFLLGLDGLTAATSNNFLGISEKDGNLRIRLIKPIPNLPELLSFGLYAIVKSDNFDLNTGLWKTRTLKNYPGAGPYFLSKIENQKLIFELRQNYPKDLFASNAFPKIVFQNDETKKLSSDIFVGSEQMDLSKADFRFHSAGETGILYFLFLPWKLKSSPLSQIKLRKRMIQLFEQNFRMIGFLPLHSFFPLVLPGVQQVNRKFDLDENNLRTGKVSFLDLRPLSLRIANDAVSAMEKAVVQAGLRALPIKKTSFREAVKNKDYNGKNFSFDIGLYSTEISLVDPAQDIKLMFSKDGIRLPDTDGKIAVELKKESYSIQEINRLIIDQSVVVPVAHLVKGIWARKSVDFSRYSTMLLLGDLQWIGHT